MPRSLPPLNALKAFEAAARHVSFTLAAAELNVTHAAVSRHIRDLEAWLGIKLFVRTGRGVELTERGKGYAAEVTRGFDILAHATDSASGRRRRRAQKLVVSVEPSFAALWLIPRLGRFTAANPDIELVLDSTNRLADFARGEADAGIRIDPPPSLACATGRMRAATAAAAPPDEPPDECSRFHGLRVGPNNRDSVVGISPNSGLAVLPKIVRPAARKRSAAVPL